MQITRRCKKCLLPNTYPGITFNKQGICTHCSQHKISEPFGGAALIDRIKTRTGDQYDCVMGISGGKDSCYVAYLAKAEFNLRVLAVCYDFPFLVDLARENIKKVCKGLGIDLLVVKSKNNCEYDFLRNHMMSLAPTNTTWGQCIFCHYGIDAVLYNVAKKHNIPFILSGITRNELWNPGSRTHFLMNRVKHLPMHEMMKFVYYQTKAFSKLVDQRLQFPIDGSHCFDVYRRAKLPVSGPETIHVFDYIHWDQNVIEQTLKEKTGWAKPDKATSWRYDCILEPLLDYTYLNEFGISTVGIYLSGLIRSNLLKRDEAIEILRKSENPVYLQQSLKDVLDYLSIPDKFQEKFQLC